MNLNVSPVMRIHNTTLNFCNHRNPQQISIDISNRNNPNIFKQLNLSNNDFSSVQFPSIPINFQVLILNNCKIQSCLQLRHIKSQKKSNNTPRSIKDNYKIANEIPHYIGKNDLLLQNLVQLQLKGNNIYDITFMVPKKAKAMLVRSPSILSSPTHFVHKLGMRGSFGFANTKIEQNCQQFFILPSLRKLNLNQNKIRKISSIIRKIFPNLIFLSIMKNQLCHLSYDLIYDCFLSQKLAPKLNKSVHMHSKKLSNASLSELSPFPKLRISHQVLNEIDFELYVAFAKDSFSFNFNRKERQQNNQEINCEFALQENETQDDSKMDKIPQQRTQSQIFSSQTDFSMQKIEFREEQNMIQVGQLLKQYISIVQQYGSSKGKSSRISVMARKSKDSNNSVGFQNNNFNTTLSSLNDSSIVKKTNQHKSNLKLIKLYESIIEHQNISSLEAIIQIITQKRCKNQNKQVKQSKNSSLEEILQFAVRNQKINCLQLLVRKLQISQGFVQQRIMAMNPGLFMLPKTSLVNRQLANQITAQAFLESVNKNLDLIRNSSKNKDFQVKKIKQFLSFLKQNRIYLIKSDEHCKNLIQEHSFGPGLSYLFENQIDEFFGKREYGNPLEDEIIKQILSIDSPELLFKFLKVKSFYQKVMHGQNFRKVVKPNWRIYRFLIKEFKKYMQQAQDAKKSLHFRQYLSFSKKQRNSQTLLIRNDLYDYNCKLLKEYQKMQGSYYISDKKTIKSCAKIINRDRCCSIAQKINSKLKNSTMLPQNSFKIEIKVQTEPENCNKQNFIHGKIGLSKNVHKSLEIQDILNINKGQYKQKQGKIKTKAFQSQLNKRNPSKSIQT